MPVTDKTYLIDRRKILCPKHGDQIPPRNKKKNVFNLMDLYLTYHHDHLNNQSLTTLSNSNGTNCSATDAHLINKYQFSDDQGQKKMKI